MPTEIQYNREATEGGMFNRGIFYNQLIILTEYVLLYSGKYKQNKKNLTKRKDFSQIYSEIRKIESDADTQAIESKPFLALHAIANRQFERQKRDVFDAIRTYYNIYKYEKLNNWIVESVYKKAKY